MRVHGIEGVGLNFMKTTIWTRSCKVSVDKFFKSPLVARNQLVFAVGEVSERSRKWSVRRQPLGLWAAHGPPHV